MSYTENTGEIHGLLLSEALALVMYIFEAMITLASSTKFIMLRNYSKRYFIATGRALFAHGSFFGAYEVAYTVVCKYALESNVKSSYLNNICVWNSERMSFERICIE